MTLVGSQEAVATVKWGRGRPKRPEDTVGPLAIGGLDFESTSASIRRIPDDKRRAIACAEVRDRAATDAQLWRCQPPALHS